MKWLKIFAWIFFPYIMIFFAWKRFGVAKRTVGALWALFILSATIASQGETPAPNTIANTNAPETEKVQPVVVEAKTSESAVPKTETETSVVSTKADVVIADQATKTSEGSDDVSAVTNAKYDVILEFPSARYPKTAAHIASAIQNGHSNVCTIDRDGADSNRDASLVGLATKAGHDRDEWPMAMCDEGGAGADVAYVPSSENRGSGSWVGNKLRDYPNGTRVLFVLDGTSDEKVIAAEKETPAKTEPVKETVKETIPAKPPVTKKDAPAKSTVEKVTPVKEPDPKPVVVEVEPEPVPAQEVYFKNCTAVRAAGADPILRGEPGYAKHLDRDGDGVGCE